MKSVSSDFLFGALVLLAGCGLLFYAGSEAAINLVWYAIYGFVVLRLNRANSKTLRVISIILMPAILWTRFLPRRMKEEIQNIVVEDL